MENYRQNIFYKETNLDNLFQNAWDIYKKNFGWFFLYSFIVVIIIQYLSSVLIGPYMEDIYGLAEDPEKAMGILKNSFLILLVMIIGYTFLHLFITSLLLQEESHPEKNHSTIFSESVSKYYLQLLGATILTSIIIFLGATIGVFFLIIGSLVAFVYLGTVFFPIVPLVIIEDVKPLDAISRCFKLVHSDFWKTVGYVVLIFLLYMILSMIISALTMAPFAGNFFDVLKDPAAAGEAANLMNNPAQLILGSIGSAVLMPMIPIFSLLIYLSLKHKEDSRNDRNEILEHFTR